MALCNKGAGFREREKDVHAFWERADDEVIKIRLIIAQLYLEEWSELPDQFRQRPWFFQNAYIQKATKMLEAYEYVAPIV